MSAEAALRIAARVEEDARDGAQIDRAVLASIIRRFGATSGAADHARADLADAVELADRALRSLRAAEAAALAERSAMPIRRLVVAGRLVPRVASPTWHAAGTVSAVSTEMSTEETIAAELGPIVGDAVDDVTFADLVDAIAAARTAA